MLRSEAQATVSELAVKLRDAADRYADAAGHSSGARAALFARLAGRHQENALRLEQQIRSLGDLPREPDPERETFERLAAHLKATLHADPDAVFIEEGQRMEAAIATLIHDTLKVPLPETVQPVLRQIQQEVADAQRQLIEADQNSTRTPRL